MKCKISLSQLPFHLAFLFLPQQTFLGLKQGAEHECFDSFSTFKVLEFLGTKNLASALCSSSLIVSTKICTASIFWRQISLLQRNQRKKKKKAVSALVVLVLSKISFYKSKWKSYHFPLDLLIHCSIFSVILRQIQHWFFLCFLVPMLEF